MRARHHGRVHVRHHGRVRARHHRVLKILSFLRPSTLAEIRKQEPTTRFREDSQFRKTTSIALVIVGAAPSLLVVSVFLLKHSALRQSNGSEGGEYQKRVRPLALGFVPPRFPTRESYLYKQRSSPIEKFSKQKHPRFRAPYRPDSNSTHPLS